jgi:hypothetical protein
MVNGIRWYALVSFINRAACLLISFCFQIQDIADGLAHLHSCEIVHGDLHNVRSFQHVLGPLLNYLTGQYRRLEWSCPYHGFRTFH